MSGMCCKTSEAAGMGGSYTQTQEIEASGDAIIIAQGLHAIAAAIRELAASNNQDMEAPPAYDLSGKPQTF